MAVTRTGIPRYPGYPWGLRAALQRKFLVLLSLPSTTSRHHPATGHFEHTNKSNRHVHFCAGFGAPLGDTRPPKWKTGQAIPEHCRAIPLCSAVSGQVQHPAHNDASTKTEKPSRAATTRRHLELGEMELRTITCIEPERSKGGIRVGGHSVNLGFWTPTRSHQRHFQKSTASRLQMSPAPPSSAKQ